MTRELMHGSIVITDYQENGKGQHGNIWLSEPGKNLLFTICLAPESLAPNKQYLLNLVSSLAIHKALSSVLTLSKVEIKWPNDIYVDDKKIAGILIETSISKGKLEQVYCGIGINVNQRHFDLPLATSLKITTGRELDRDEILESILISFEGYYSLLERGSMKLMEDYVSKLRWLGVSSWYNISGEKTEGVITGIDELGKLLVQIGNEMRSFNVKEIEFLY